MSDPTRNRIALVVDDDRAVRGIVAKGLEPLGFARVLLAEDGEAAKPLLEEHEIDVVITDLMMPRLDGLGLMRWAREHRPGPVWIILSGVETFDAAVDAIQLGAFDYLTKPISGTRLEIAVRNGLAQRDHALEKERLLSELHATSIELLGKVRELEHTTAVIRKDLERAEVIQRALLPARPPQVDGLRVHALYRPGEYVGGDLYDVVALGEHHLGFYVADATGHGVSAAMLSVLFKQRFVMIEGGAPLSPAQALERVNRSLVQDVVAPGLFVTVVYGLLDTRSGGIVVASAGHTPLVARIGSETLVVERGGPALGIAEDAVFAERRLTFGAGDRLLLFTDGLLGGWTPPSDAEPGADPLRELLSRSLEDLPPGEAALQALVAAALGRQAALDRREGRDDITLLLLEASAGSSSFDNGDGHAREPEQAQPDTPKAVLWSAKTDEGLQLEVRGRGTWNDSDTFLRLARSAADEGQKIDVGLGECEYLDSTFLGTLHELVCQCEAGEVCIHDPSAAIRALFDELGLEQVLRCVDAQPVTPLEELVPVPPASSARESQLRLLRAHETLASLSEGNRRKFLAVVEALRAELVEGGDAPEHP